MTRIKKVIAKMNDEGLHQIMMTDPVTIYYLTGEMIQPGERFLALLLRGDGTRKLFLNRLFTAESFPEDEIVYYTDEQRGAVIAAGYTDHDEALGVDKRMAAEFLLELQENGAASAYRNGSRIVDYVRQHKDEEEQRKMIAASEMNDRVMARIRTKVHEGVTEKELADELLKIYAEEGAEGFSFTPIVSFGEHAGDPHHEPDGTVLTKDQCVLFDIGGLMDGYCSDMTRTYYFGEPAEEERKIYEIVKRANEAAEAMIRPGVRFCDIDKTARDVIEEAGYGPNFTHRLGHSIGMEVHEFGDVSSVNTAIVEEGMTFSCEPGIYLYGKYGVRIEDLCLVTADGVKILNHASKELQKV